LRLDVLDETVPICCEGIAPVMKLTYGNSHGDSPPAISR
jgi:hypothetical protein